MNQSFNSVVNYTNRNASTSVTTEQLFQAYAAASTASVLTAVGMNKWISKRPTLSGGLIGRLVPLMAVAAANCVNIPLMRQRELIEGINVEAPDTTEVGGKMKVIGKSQIAAQQAVGQVIPSRILMAVPGMFLPPLIMNSLEKNSQLLKRFPLLAAPLTIGLTGFCLVFSTPLCCALFPQKSILPIDQLEPQLRNKLHGADVHHVIYNKGL